MLNTKKHSSLWNSSAPGEIKLCPSDLHIWHTCTNITKAQADAAYSMLSMTEQDRSKRFKFDHDRLRFIAVRSTLREILSYYLSIKPALISFTENGYGKPMLDGVKSDTNIFFNISHAHNRAIYAISKEENLGVDIEFTDR